MARVSDEVYAQACMVERRLTEALTLVCSVKEGTYDDDTVHNRLFCAGDDIDDALRHLSNLVETRSE
jgi:hypothetical protein